MHLQTILLLSIFFFGSLANSLPLSTNGRWIVDDATGNRVKLRCANWPGHMETLLVLGLNKKPLGDIIDSLPLLGLNCVRLTYSIYMFTNISNEKLTVTQSFQSLGLEKEIDGIAKNNPTFPNLTVHEAYDAVVDELGKKGIMVVLDNHVSKPQWCCDNNDGNGFFRDKYFNPKEWLKGLTIVANRYKDKSQVVAMSLRNELRGPGQNMRDWYRYVGQGARRVHKTNPKVLVIISGLNYDTELDFLRVRPLRLNVGNKLVFEAHWYSFSNGRNKDWAERPHQTCALTMKEFDNQAWFLTTGKKPFPLFVSEFGVDQRGANVGDNKFLSCFLAYAGERDLDWALWAFQGTYYLRNGIVDMEETYGVLDTNWNPRNPNNFKEKFSIILDMLQDPESKQSTDQILYHPLSGRCVFVDGKNNIQLTSCEKRSHWTHVGDGSPIKLMGTSMCLKVVKDGLPATLSTDCSTNQSIWKIVSSPKLHLSTTDEQGRSLCLENNPSNSSAILTKECTCLTDDQCQDNTETQWFKLIPTNVK